MTINLHTPDGIAQHELTPQELEQFAADGDYNARIEIARAEIATHIDLHKKIALLAWALVVTDTRPKAVVTP